MKYTRTLHGLGLGLVLASSVSAQVTRRMSVSTSGQQANGGSFLPSISGDGLTVAFESLGSNLVGGDTNVGERRAGQGVASLQKALHMAGARTVITSLWKVPDEATKELMLDFYRRIWIEKQPKAQALWEAKTRLRDAKDESGRPKYTTRDWAAWVLTGEPD